MRDAVEGTSGRVPTRCLLIEEAPPFSPTPLSPLPPTEDTANNNINTNINTNTTANTNASAPGVGAGVGPKVKVLAGAGKSVPVASIRVGDVFACRCVCVSWSLFALRLSPLFCLCL